MTTPAQCPRCGATLPPDTAPESCPKCLLQVGLADTEPGADTKTSIGASAPPAPAPAELAADFPQLEILEMLGRGGMGVVYKARQKSLDRMVALKILTVPDSAGPDFAERFSREAKALASLSHPAIVTVYDFGKAGDRYFLMMEYVDGANLHRLIRGGEIKPGQALELVSRICDALQFAHESGVVHRDIKPENILVDQKGRVKIADFGLAKILGQAVEPTRLTGANQVMGTAHYMAPEQLERPLEVDHRADIYSLGVVFYELLTGELPIGRFQPPSRKIQVDVRVDDVVLKTLEKEPELRYQKVEELKTQVDGIKSSLREGGQTTPEEPIHVYGWTFNPSPWMVAGVGVALLALIAVAVLIFASLSGRDLPAFGVTVENPVVGEVSVGAVASEETPESVPRIMPPLVMAAARGSQKMVDSLLGAGADVNAVDSSGTTALSAAVDRGHEDLVPLLLARGADPDIANSHGATPLMIATSRGDQSAVVLLLGAGADPNASDQQGWTALLCAVDRDHLDLAQMLLGRGADVDARLDSGVTSLMMATSQGDRKLVEILLGAGADVGATAQDGTTALGAAVDRGHQEIVDLLLARGAG